METCSCSPPPAGFGAHRCSLQPLHPSAAGQLGLICSRCKPLHCRTFLQQVLSPAGVCLPFFCKQHLIQAMKSLRSTVGTDRRSTEEGQGPFSHHSSSSRAGPYCTEGRRAARRHHVEGNTFLQQNSRETPFQRAPAQHLPCIPSSPLRPRQSPPWLSRSCPSPTPLLFLSLSTFFFLPELRNESKSTPQPLHDTDAQPHAGSAAEALHAVCSRAAMLESHCRKGGCSASSESKEHHSEMLGESSPLRPDWRPSKDSGGFRSSPISTQKPAGTRGTTCTIRLLFQLTEEETGTFRGERQDSH